MHQRDHRRRKRLAEQKCCRHRQRRHDVEPDVALPEAAHDLDAESRKDWDHTCRPRNRTEIAHLFALAGDEEKSALTHCVGRK
jgi:hypothetical protein